MAEICGTCLSRDRKLVPLDSISYGMIFGEKAGMNLDVCWECMALFRRLQQFKSQVLHAQACLDVMSRPTYSKLQVTEIKFLDICCQNTYDIDSTQETKPNVHQTMKCTIEVEHIKQEINETDTQNDVKESKNAHIKYEHTESSSSDSESTTESSSFEEEERPKKQVKKRVLKKKVVKKEKPPNPAEPPNYMPVQMSEEELEKRRLGDRLSQKYQEVYKFKCDSCIAGFYTEERYQKHIATRHAEIIGPYMCRVCLVRFPKQAAYRRHVDAHFRKYQCKICNLIAYKLSEIKYHDASEHGNMKFKCTICDVPFTTKSAARFHREKFHSEPRDCEHCDKSFRTADCLRIHKLTMHNDAPMSTCHLCGAKCRRLDVHMQQKHDNAAVARRKHDAYCAECDKRFSTIYIYRSHLKYSSAHRPSTLKLTCKECESTFVSSIGLKQHMRAKHQKDWIYKCDICDKGFHGPSRLKAHVLHNHEGVERPKDKICHFCGRGFTSKLILSNHLRTHTGERPFKCELCPAAFKQRTALVTHCRGVHKTTPK